MLLIPLINHGPMVLQGLCGCVGIVTFFRESSNKSGLSFCIYTHEGLKGHKGPKRNTCRGGPVCPPLGVLYCVSSLTDKSLRFCCVFLTFSFCCCNIFLW